MQTFLPYPDFRKSLECLDNKRLGKQRVEAMQIINVLELMAGESSESKNMNTSYNLGGRAYGWRNHPAVKMWKGHKGALMVYHDMAIHIWKERGFRNTMALFFGSAKNATELSCGIMLNPAPFWLGNPAFHAAHRSNLLRKDPVHYGKFGWTEPHDLPYIWPSNEKVTEREDS